ncbi:hypothetical protein PN498_02215 [Oscillatoria sp. CS-180]|uniref:hypothetical protein n=1 Tax=Oscillatoria sp. CS-180 TaxID=3021720 RepID=UPI00233068ED|nr:hypothetical protein [Oscillatoria sp. CS-180]MDB9524789.1 hypothetical protein [Oscillatoria sp. CS-180]
MDKASLKKYDPELGNSLSTQDSLIHPEDISGPMFGRCSNALERDEIEVLAFAVRDVFSEDKVCELIE